MTCDNCNAPIKHSQATGLGDGYWMVYDKETDKWRRLCQVCYEERKG